MPVFPMPKAQLYDLFFNDLTADEIDGLVEIMGNLDPYEIVGDEPKFSPAHQFVIERFLDLKRRLKAHEVEAAEKKLIAEFGPGETVIDTV